MVVRRAKARAANDFCDIAKEVQLGASQRTLYCVDDILIALILGDHTRQEGNHAGAGWSGNV